MVADRIGNFYAGVILYFLESVMRRSESWRDWLVLKTVCSCYLMGVDERSGKNFDHRKRWLEEKLKQLAANFGIDLLLFSACRITFIYCSGHGHLSLKQLRWIL